MKALLCKEFGPPETLSYEEIEDPVLKEGHKGSLHIFKVKTRFEIYKIGTLLHRSTFQICS